jgi:hypothetical protein
MLAPDGKILFFTSVRAMAQDSIHGLVFRAQRGSEMLVAKSAAPECQGHLPRLTSGRYRPEVAALESVRDIHSEHARAPVAGAAGADPRATLPEFLASVF